MNILIVEDGELKARRLAECVVRSNDRAKVFQATNAHDAFKLLTETEFSLLLLDVRLPISAGLQPTDSGSVWLLREIARKLPKKQTPIIVGTTQYDAAVLKAQEVFSDYLWSIVLVSETDNRWQKQLAQIIGFVASKTTVASLSKQTRPVDAAILTALRYPEYERVVESLGGGGEFHVVEETNERWLRAKVQLPNEREAEVICACADEMGMCSMATLVTRLCIATRPKKLILAGIMGGNSARVEMGDLILIDETWDYRAGKITENGFEADVRSQRCSLKIRNGVQGVVTNSLLQSAWENWTGDKPRSFPRLHVGAVACSPAVVADAKIFEELESQKRKVLGVEMEAYGCYDAALRLGDFSPSVVCIKSVCDLGDKAKSDKYQSYCAFLSAYVANALVNNTEFLDS